MELNCSCKENNETLDYCYPVSSSETFSGETCSLVRLFLESPLNIVATVGFGLAFISFNFLVYFKTKNTTIGPPSFFPIVNVILCSGFYTVFPTIKYYLNIGIFLINSQIGCCVYAFCFRAFVLLLPLTMLQIFLEIFFGKLKSKQLKFPIFVTIWIVVLLFAILGTWMIEYSNENGKCSLVLLMGSKTLHIIYEIFFWFCASILSTFILVLIVHLLKSRKDQLEFSLANPHLSELKVPTAKKKATTNCGFALYFVSILLFLILGQYLPAAFLLDPENIQFQLSDGLLNRFDQLYLLQLFQLPSIFLLSRLILGNERLNPKKGIVLTISSVDGVACLARVVNEENKTA